LIAGLGRGDGAWPQLAGWFEQRAAQVLEQPQPVSRHGEPAPAGRWYGPSTPSAGAAAFRHALGEGVCSAVASGWQCRGRSPRSGLAGSGI